MVSKTSTTKTGVAKYPGYRTMTAAQRYNARMAIIWDAAKDAQTNFNASKARESEERTTKWTLTQPC